MKPLDSVHATQGNLRRWRFPLCYSCSDFAPGKPEQVKICHFFWAWNKCMPLQASRGRYEIEKTEISPHGIAYYHCHVRTRDSVEIEEFRSEKGRHAWQQNGVNCKKSMMFLLPSLMHHFSIYVHRFFALCAREIVVPSSSGQSGVTPTLQRASIKCLIVHSAPPDAPYTIFTYSKA